MSNTGFGAIYPAIQFRIARPTNKLKEIENFYVNGLGLKKLGSFEEHNGYNGIMLGLPNAQHHLEFTQDEHNTPCHAPTKDNLLVLYFKSTKELELVKNKLEDLGVKPVEPENPYWKDKGYTYEDPDGWRVVLFDGLYH